MQVFINPFLPITVEHLSYLTQVIEICVLEYPVKVVSDLSLSNISSPVKVESALKGVLEGGGGVEQTKAKFSFPV